MKPQKENRGGARPNTGPKLKYGEKTKRITFSCPLTKEIEFIQYAENKLKTYLKNDIYSK